MTKPEVSQNNSYINREISWLQFNARVLQEAQDETVPLIERLRFLGIFSNNLDEFFKVRYATVKRIVQAGKGGKNQLGGIRAKELLEIITQIVINQQSESLEILNSIGEKLKEENIHIIDETQIDDAQHDFIKQYSRVVFHELYFSYSSIGLRDYQFKPVLIKQLFLLLLIYSLHDP